MTRRVWLVLLFALPVHADEVVETKHYRLHGAGDDAAALGRLLEAAWGEMEAYFDAKPRTRTPLDIHLLPDRAALAAAPGGEGADGDTFYDPETETAYAVRQDTPHETRSMLLRAAARQFHLLARARNKEPVAFWWRHGVAEYLAGHQWDGTTLRLGVPPFSPRDLPGRALAQVRAEGFALVPVVEAEVDGGRPLAWALYAWVASGGEGGEPRPGFAKFARKMDGGVKPAPLFWKTFGKPGEVGPALEAWLASAQPPWMPVSGAWEALGPDRLAGTAPEIGVCRLQAAASELKVTFEPPADAARWRAGALLSWAGPEEYAVALLDWAGYLRITRFSGGRWNILEQGPGPGAPADGVWRFQLFRRKDQVYLMFAGGASYGPWQLPGTGFGLAVEGGSMTFRDLTWK